MDSSQELGNLLDGFIGTENYYRHWADRNFLYTDGVKAFADNAGGGAYWLLDILATQPEVRKGANTSGFLVVSLTVKGGVAELAVSEDIHNRKPTGLCYIREIGYTDCPDGIWVFYMQAGQGEEGKQTIICLTNEY